MKHDRIDPLVRSETQSFPPIRRVPARQPEFLGSHLGSHAKPLGGSRAESRARPLCCCEASNGPEGNLTRGFISVGDLALCLGRWSPAL